MHKVRLGNLLVSPSLKTYASLKIQWVTFRLWQWMPPYTNCFNQVVQKYPREGFAFLGSSPSFYQCLKQIQRTPKGTRIAWLVIAVICLNLFPFLTLPNNLCICFRLAGINTVGVKDTRHGELEWHFRECGERGKCNGKEPGHCDSRLVVHVRVKQSTCRELMELVYSPRRVNLSTLDILTTFFKAWNHLVLISEQGLAAHTAAGLDNY